MVMAVLVRTGAKYIPLTARRIICMDTHNRSHLHFLLALSCKLTNLLQIIPDKVIKTLHLNVMASVTP